MLERKAYAKLLDWKENGRKPLLVYGQRQTGKTFIIERFAKENYSGYVYADFSKDAEFRSVFEGQSLSIDRIILSIRTVRSLGSEDLSDTLFFFDEIQDCDAAFSALKLFAMDGRFKVIASGSMLGIRINGKEGSGDRRPLSPMGYVEPYVMRSMDFEEFLWSQGIPKESVSEVRRCIRSHVPIPDPIFGKFSDLFRAYMIVGGMPAAVEAFNENRESYVGAMSVQDSILALVGQDINRYNSGMDLVKTLECFESIPGQLSKTNKRFHYSDVGKAGTGSRKSADVYGGNLHWIKNAGYGNFVHGLNQISLPLTGQSKPDVFKVYMSDTGLLTRMYGDGAVIAIHSSDYSYNLGALTENVVAEGLVKCGFDVFYYQKNNGSGRMEVDFVIAVPSGAVAIEVKSGKKRESPSLSKVGEVFKLSERVKLENGHSGVDKDGVIHMPLFAAAFMDSFEDRPPFLKRGRLEIAEDGRCWNGEHVDHWRRLRRVREMCKRLHTRTSRRRRRKGPRGGFPVPMLSVRPLRLDMP
ncbi:MAG: ATP-binding protein [Candidatus Methanomethylophilaceae archaeon]|nr:ATP-binding protein [Candidatus Methanomethylophilaceae archaeon]